MGFGGGSFGGGSGGGAAFTEATLRSTSATLTASLPVNAQKITSLADGTANTDAATFGQLSAVANGRDPKDSVRSASTANVTLSAPGASIGGVTMASGEHFLAKNQTTASENGLYTFNGAATPATRRADADTSAEVTSGLTVYVSEGTHAGQTWTLSTTDPITLGTTSLTFVQTGGTVGVSSYYGTYASRPAAGNAGRVAHYSDIGAVEQVDTGGEWKNKVPSGHLMSEPAGSFPNTTNVGTATIAKVANVLKISGQAAAGPLVRLWGKPIVTLAQAKVWFSAASVGPTFVGAGVYVRHAGSQKFAAINLVSHSNFLVACSHWASATSRTNFNDVTLSTEEAGPMLPMLRIDVSDGTNVFYQISTDGGYSWRNLRTDTYTTVFGAGNNPDDFGVCHLQQNASVGSNDTVFGLDFSGA